MIPALSRNCNAALVRTSQSFLELEFLEDWGPVCIHRADASQHSVEEIPLNYNDDSDRDNCIFIIEYLSFYHSREDRNDKILFSLKINAV